MDQGGATIPMTHDRDGPTVSLEEAQRIERDTAQHLYRSRKLSLIVDLDQTIVHATVDPTVGEWIAEGEAWEARQAKKAEAAAGEKEEGEKEDADADEGEREGEDEEEREDDEDAEDDEDEDEKDGHVGDDGDDEVADRSARRAHEDEDFHYDYEYESQGYARL